VSFRTAVDVVTALAALDHVIATVAAERVVASPNRVSFSSPPEGNRRRCSLTSNPQPVDGDGRDGIAADAVIADKDRLGP
jgi:hypothetical protein